MFKRSPIRGYNHNISYRGLIFHVQTEDSGVDNPHIFTHLFYGGVIINTRKLTYDPEAADEVIKALMQAQHKAVLKELNRGRFDDKIDAYLVDVPELLPREDTDKTASQPPEDATDELPIVPDDEESLDESFIEEIITPTPLPPVSLPPPLPLPPPLAPPPPIIPTAVASPPPIPETLFRSRSIEQEMPTVHFNTAPTPSRRSGVSDALQAIVKRAAAAAEDVAEIHSPPPFSGAFGDANPSPRITQPRIAVPAPRGVGRGHGEGSNVIVSRPSVIIGQPQGTASARKSARARREDSIDNLFVGDSISEKSLDEVILAYLSEDTED